VTENISDLESCKLTEPVPNAYNNYQEKIMKICSWMSMVSKNKAIVNLGSKCIFPSTAGCLS
jgi:hypothetical protein